MTLRPGWHVARAKGYGCAGVRAASPHLTSPHLTSPHLTSPHLTSPHLTSPHLTSPHLTSPHITSPHLTSPHPTSPHLTSPHITSPHLTSPHLTSPHLTSPHPTSPHLHSLEHAGNGRGVRDGQVCRAAQTVKGVAFAACRSPLPHNRVLVAPSTAAVACGLVCADGRLVRTSGYTPWARRWLRATEVDRANEKWNSGERGPSEPPLNHIARCCQINLSVRKHPQHFGGMLVWVCHCFPWGGGGIWAFFVSWSTLCICAHMCIYVYVYMSCTRRVYIHTLTNTMSIQGVCIYAYTLHTLKPWRYNTGHCAGGGGDAVPR